MAGAKMGWACVTAVLLCVSGTTAQTLCETFAPIALADQQWPRATADGSCAGGVYTITGSGHDFWWGWDRGAFCFVETNPGDFVFSARVNTPSRCSRGAKFGVMAREKLTSNARQVGILWDGAVPVPSWKWVVRPTEGIVGEEKNPATHFDGIVTEVETAMAWLKVVRLGGVFSVQVSADGQEWFTVKDKVGLGWDTKANVGFALSCETSVSAKFDNIECSNCAGFAEVSTDRASLPRQRWRAVQSGRRVVLDVPDGATIHSVALYDLHGARVAAGIGREVVLPSGVSRQGTSVVRVVSSMGIRCLSLEGSSLR